MRDAASSGDGDVGAALARLLPRLRRYLSLSLAARFDDDPSQIGAADLYDAVQHLSRLYRTISSFLPGPLVQERTMEQQEGHSDPAGFRPQGRFLTGSLLFADVSGFTAMSERLATLGPEGAETLTNHVNHYFEVVLDRLSKSGGVLLKFAGDAVLAFFPRHDSQGNVAPDARWAIRAGLRMQRAMAQFARIEVAGDVFALRMSVGINSGRFLAASVGTHQRREYVITGQVVHDIMAIESTAESGQVVIGHSTRQLIGDRFRLRGNDPYVVEDDLGDDLGDYEMSAPVWRPARLGAVYDRSVSALVRQLERSLPLVESLAPYLAPDLLDRLVAHPEQRAVESEYRPTTVVFANFDGLNEMLNTLGRGNDSAAQATELLNRYFVAMQDIVARYGGIISRIDPHDRGSKLLALFGAPVKHDDDPLRAVGAALEMQEAVRRFAALRTRQGAFCLRQRIGITHGLTFAGRAGTTNRQEYTVMGDDVNLAARLMGAAEMGQILISGRVYDAVAPFTETTALAPIRVKGKSQPVPVWGVTARKTARERPAIQGPLVDRAAELAAGQAAIEAALAGQGRVMAIGGETGIGKSRLAAELIARGQARRMNVLRGDCLPHGRNVPYFPWAELLHNYFELDADEEALRTEPEEGPLFREARPATRSLRATMSKRERIETELRALGVAGGSQAIALSELMGLTVPTSVSGRPTRSESPAEGVFGRLQQRVTERAEARVNLWQLAGERLRTRQMPRAYALIADLVRRRAAKQPLVLIIEDVHWIDGPSLELLNFVIESIADWPTLLIITHRPDARLPDWAAHPHFQAITLSGLRRADSLALAASLLGVQTLPEALGQLLFDRSQGNPLFIRELAQGIRESEAVEVDETAGEVRLRGDVATLRIPASVGEVILSRIDRLPAGERGVLRAAAVAGQSFHPEALRRLVTTVDLEGHLRHLTETGLLVVAGGGRYAFQHSLVREVAYDSLSLARRRRLHRAVCDYYEAECRGEALVEHYELLAHHARLSGQEGKAARYALLAGHKARGRAAYQPAIGYYRQSVEAMERGMWRDDDERLSVYEGLGDVCALAGEYPAAAEAYRQALAMAVDAAALHGKLGLLCPLAGDDEGALAALRLAWDALDEGEAGRRQAVAAALGWLLWERGETGEAARWRQRGLAVEGGPLTALVHWVGGLAAEGQDDEAEARFREAVAGWQAAGEPRGLALACGRLADLYERQGREQLAAEYRQRAADSRAVAPSKAAGVPDHRPVYRQLFHLAVEAFLGVVHEAH